MLIPVKPSKALHRAKRHQAEEGDGDVEVEVVASDTPEVEQVGRAKSSGRTAIFNRKGP